MPKLSIDGVRTSYEVMDCTNKIVVLKIPYDIYGDKNTYNEVINLSKCLKKVHNVKTLICMVDTFNIDAVDKDKAIHMLDGYINQLNDVREKLLKNDEVSE